MLHHCSPAMRRYLLQQSKSNDAMMFLSDMAAHTSVISSTEHMYSPDNSSLKVVELRSSYLVNIVYKEYENDMERISPSKYIDSLNHIATSCLGKITEASTSTCSDQTTGCSSHYPAHQSPKTEPVSMEANCGPQAGDDCMVTKYTDGFFRGPRPPMQYFPSGWELQHIEGRSRPPVALLAGTMALHLSGSDGVESLQIGRCAVDPVNGDMLGIFFQGDLNVIVVSIRITGMNTKSKWVIFCDRKALIDGITCADTKHILAHTRHIQYSTEFRPCSFCGAPAVPNGCCCEMWMLVDEGRLYSTFLNPQATFELLFGGRYEGHSRTAIPSPGKGLMVLPGVRRLTQETGWASDQMAERNRISGMLLQNNYFPYTLPRALKLHTTLSDWTEMTEMSDWTETSASAGHAGTIGTNALEADTALDERADRQTSSHSFSFNNARLSVRTSTHSVSFDNTGLSVRAPTHSVSFDNAGLSVRAPTHSVSFNNTDLSTRTPTHSSAPAPKPTTRTPVRKLSSEESREAERQRKAHERKLRNRDAALRSNQKRSQNYKQLVANVEQRRERLAELRKRLDELRQENRALKQSVVTSLTPCTASMSSSWNPTPE